MGLRSYLEKEALPHLEDARPTYRRACFLSVMYWLLSFVCLHLSYRLSFLPWLASLLVNVLIFTQVYSVIQWHKHLFKKLPLAYPIAHQQWQITLGLSLLVIACYSWGYHVYRAGDLFFQFPPLLSKHLFSWGFFMQFLEQVLLHSVGVAIPEELFYRGYLQRLWEDPLIFSKHPENSEGSYRPSLRGLLLSNAAFAIGHLAANGSLQRLTTFFPGLLFGYLAQRYPSLWPSVCLHACCNVLQWVLLQVYC